MVARDNFKDLDAEVRIKLLFEYIQILRGGFKNDGKMLSDTNVEVALRNAYKQLEEEFKAGESNESG